MSGYQKSKNIIYVNFRKDISDVTQISNEKKTKNINKNKNEEIV